MRFCHLSFGICHLVSGICHLTRGDFRMNETQREGKIIKVSGPLVVAEGLAGS